MTSMSGVKIKTGRRTEIRIDEWKMECEGIRENKLSCDMSIEGKEFDLTIEKSDDGILVGGEGWKKK